MIEDKDAKGATSVLTTALYQAAEAAVRVGDAGPASFGA